MEYSIEKIKYLDEKGSKNNCDEFLFPQYLIEL